MKLHAVNGMFAVNEAHDFSLGGFGRDFQALGKCVPLHDERVITRGLERRGQSGKNPGIFVKDGRGFPVHEPIGAHDFTAVDLADALMTKADAQDRDTGTEAAYHIAADAGLVRSARTRRHTDVMRCKSLDFGQSDFIIPAYKGLNSQLTKILDKVVSERVVVIDDQEHGWSGLKAISYDGTDTQAGKAVGGG